MNNFIFKSANRLIKNDSITLEALLIRKLDLILEQNRAARCDLVDVNKKLQRLMIDKHLQLQVDDYFENHDLEDK